jgi:predicted O-linked N-acetylglucosamine transferase (SPINDLY family)
MDTTQTLTRAVELHRTGRLEEAERLYREALKTSPDEPDALHLLGALRHQRGDHAAAAELIGRAVALNPRSPAYHYNLGNAQKGLGLLAAAAESYRREIAINPGFAKAYNNLGNVLSELRDVEGAIEAFRRAVAIDGAAAEFHTNLGSALAEAGRFEAAAASHRRALELKPDLVAAHVNLGDAMVSLNQLVEAELHFRRALDLDPADFEAAESLAFLYSGLGDFEQTFAWFDRARALAPDRVSIYRGILVAALYHPGFDNACRFAEHLRFARVAAAHGPSSVPSFPNSRDPARRLRIGWLSSDFRNHPVGRNIAPLLEQRDRSHFEAYCYSEQHKPDAVTAQFRNLADVWRPIAGLTDKELARLIRSDGIDILIVIAGRFDLNRFCLPVQRAAPVQISLYDAATSGLAATDFLLSDRLMTPRHSAERFTERLLRLPGLYIHRPIDMAPEPGPPPARAAGHVTFGCFNNPVKINDHVLAAWGEILWQVPGSRLVLKYQDFYRSPERRARMNRRLATHGIDPARVEMRQTREAHAAHLASYASIDIALDPFPFNGSTVTFEALWMGVPVVALAGDHFMARWSSAMLLCAGLADLVAPSIDEYVSIARALAQDAGRLAGLRATLRDRVRNSPVCDARGRARQVERLMRAVWRRWCAAETTVRA